MTITAVILAAGASKRMKSSRSKVLHPLAGRPLLHFPVLAAVKAGAQRCVVVASPDNRQDVQACLEQLAGVSWQIAIQESPRGTGDAAKAAMPLVESDEMLLLCGDTPLIEASALAQLIETGRRGCLLSLLSCELEEPQGYGRVLRSDDGRVASIREQKDLEPEQESIREVNAGMYFGSVTFFKRALEGLKNDNAQGEYYATDVVAAAAREGSVECASADAGVLQGVNDRKQLNSLEQLLFERIADRHRDNGVSIRGDAEIDDTVLIGADTFVASGVALRGNTRVGSGCTIDKGCVVMDSEIADGALLKPYTVVTESRVGPNAELGPFAQLRPGSEIGERAKIGNFVETKNTTLGVGAKANHLTYLGDASVGAGANLGAGTIICNYDGFSKSRTEIGEGAFIGSDSQLIAPLRIGAGAYVATGTTVTQDIPDHGLALSRVQQINKPDYAPKLRQKLQARAEEKKAAKAKAAAKAGAAAKAKAR